MSALVRPIAEQVAVVMVRNGRTRVQLNGAEKRPFGAFGIPLEGVKMPPRMRRRSAPSALRIPISRRRRATVNDSMA